MLMLMLKTMTLQISKSLDVVDFKFRVETLDFQDLAGKLRAGARKALTASQSLRFANIDQNEQDLAQILGCSDCIDNI